VFTVVRLLHEQGGGYFGAAPARPARLLHDQPGRGEARVGARGAERMGVGWGWGVCGGGAGGVRGACGGVRRDDLQRHGLRLVHVQGERDGRVEVRPARQGARGVSVRSQHLTLPSPSREAEEKQVPRPVHAHRSTHLMVPAGKRSMSAACSEACEGVGVRSECASAGCT
jgi:hypothetical protein